MTVRWGIVTTAKISHDFVNAFNSYPEKVDAAIVAVAARNKDKAAEFAKVHNIPHVADSYEALAASDVIDAAYIGSLHPYHYPLAKLFLENGKHVLCEKPLCLNYKQTQSLVNLARSKKLFLMEAVWSRFAPSYKALEKEIAEGKIGEPMFVEANFGIVCEGVERLHHKSMGGSALLDLGIYTLQFAQYIFKDEPIRVTAVGELNGEGVDLVDTLILEYTGGRKAVLNIHAKVKLWNKATVTGTKGRITMEDPFHFAHEMIHANGEKETFPLHSSNIYYNFGNSAGLVYEALEATNCIKKGLIESPRMSHKESLLLAKLEDTVRQQVGVHYDVDDLEFP